MITKDLQQKTLDLKPVDKFHLVELILESLDRPDPAVEKAWVAESEARYAAYKKDKITPVGFNSIQRKLTRWK